MGGFPKPPQIEVSGNFLRAFCFFFGEKKIEDVFLGLFAFELSMRRTKIACWAVERFAAAVATPAFRLCAYGLRGFFNPYSSVGPPTVTFWRFGVFFAFCAVFDWLKKLLNWKKPGLLLECLWLYISLIWRHGLRLVRIGKQLRDRYAKGVYISTYPYIS